MRRAILPVIIALLLAMVIADAVSASHWPADGSPRRIHGTDLVLFLIVAFWPVQVGVALMVSYDAGQRGMAARWRWLVLVGVPAIGFLIATGYTIYTRMEDRRDLESSHSQGTPGQNIRSEVHR